jgi:hypothetical protein
MPSAAKTASNLDGVLGVPIPDEEAKRTPPSQFEGEVPGLLRDPGGVGMPRRSGHVDPPCVDFQHEEHVQRAQPRSLHRKEVGGEDPRGLVAQELGPCRRSMSRSRAKPLATQQRANRGGRDRDPELGQLALDPQASPTGVLPAHTEDEVSHLLGDRWPPAERPAGVGPLPTHQLTVPTKERLRADQEGRPARTRECPARRCEEQPIPTAKSRPPHLSPEDG